MTTKRTDIFSKCLAWDEEKRTRELGLYTFFRPIEATSGGTVVSHGQRRVMIGSNNYLGLTHHPRVIAAAKRAIDRYGTSCTGSRLLNGNLALHEEFEAEFAQFLGKEAALVFATGFLTNLGALSCLSGRKDVIYCDRENHASIYEGMRLSLGSVIKYRHGDLSDLERLLQSTRDKYEGALIVADGVFSMSGEILNLPAITELARKYDCRVYVDDAHALGVLGPQGRGTEWHFGTPGAADLVMTTFSKSFASTGGALAGDADVINYIKHKARPFVFSAAIPPAGIAAALECLRIVQEEPDHLANLWSNTETMSYELQRLGFNTLGSKTPIIPLLIGDAHTAYLFAQKLYEHGVFATPVAPPAVPAGQALIRTSYTALHTSEDLEHVLEVLEKLGRAFGIISGGLQPAISSEQVEPKVRAAGAGAA